MSPFIKQTLIAILGFGIVLISAILLTGGKEDKGKPLQLEGGINDVSVEKLSDGAHVVLLYITAANPSKRPFEVKNIEVTVGPEKYAVSGGVLSKRELAGLLEFRKLKDQDPAIGPGDVVEGGQRVNRMLGVRFESGIKDFVDAQFHIRFHDVHDVVSVIPAETAKKPSK